MNSHIVNPIARIVNSHKKTYFAGLLAGAALLLGGGTAHAQRDKNCPARMQQAQQDLSQAMRRYGMNSPEAQHERDELQNVAESCGYARGGYGYNDGDRDDRGRDNRSYSNGDHGYNGAYGDGGDHRLCAVAHSPNEGPLVSRGRGLGWRPGAAPANLRGSGRPRCRRIRAGHRRRGIGAGSGRRDSGTRVLRGCRSLT